MASSLSPYLRLKYPTTNTNNWSGELASNWNTIDTLGKHLKIQSSVGDSMALRVSTVSGSLVEALTVRPNSDGSLSIQLGRAGSNDKIVYAGSLAFNTITLANSRPGTFAAYSLKLRAAFDNSSDCIVSLDTQQNTEVILSFPTDWAHAKPWAGSMAQLELENSTTRNRQCLLTFTIKDNAGSTHTFAVPTYLQS